MMKQMRDSSKLNARASSLALAFALIGATSASALAQSAASFDHGERLIVSYHWKIEHRATNPIEIAVDQLGTPEGRKILAGIASVVGVNPALATIVTANIPLPHLNAGDTDNRGVLAAPSGMTVCKAGHGYIEASHASWSASIARNNKQNGLRFYTSVGTSPGTTHRVQGDFWVEYVKPVNGWEKKFNCMPNGTVVWDQHG